MKNRNGFTVIELLVVLAIIVVMIALIVPLFSIITGSNKTFDAKVIDVWTDIDGDGNQIYRCRTQSPSGEVNTWNSYWIHNQLQNGGYYHFTAKPPYLSTIKPATEVQNVAQ